MWTYFIKPRVILQYITNITLIYFNNNDGLDLIISTISSLSNSGLTLIKSNNLSLYFLFITYLASCSNPQDSKKIGQVLGAISGTIIGSKLGKGAGKNFYTASGAIVGSIIGKNLGEIISKTDIDYINQSLGVVIDALNIFQSLVNITS